MKKITISKNPKKYNDFLPILFSKKYDEYEILRNNLTFPVNQTNIANFIDFNYNKALQYKTVICLDPKNEMYNDLTLIEKNKLKIIHRKIDRNVIILKSRISKKRKIFHIAKLNKALINFLDIKDDPVNDLIIKTKRIRINKK